MLKTIVLKKFPSKKKHKVGSTISLRRGYVRHLIKQGYVLSHNEDNNKVAEEILLEEKKKKEAKLAQAEMVKKSLEKENISFIVTNCNGNGVLFGAISIKDIVSRIHAINQQLYGAIRANHIVLKKAIKTYGVYECNIFIYDEVETKINVYVGASNDAISKMISVDKKKNEPKDSETDLQIGDK